MKKFTRPWVFSMATLLFLFSGLAWADPPELQDKGRVQDGGSDLRVDYNASPTTADWNNDGAKDLIVGEADGGQIRLYLNQGTDLNPVFSGYTEIEMNGYPIAMTWSQ